MGTIAGTRVLCTQYPARVTNGRDAQLDANVTQARSYNMVDVLGPTPDFLTPHLTLTITLTLILTRKTLVWR